MKLLEKPLSDRELIAMAEINDGQITVILRLDLCDLVAGIACMNELVDDRIFTHDDPDDLLEDRVLENISYRVAGAVPSNGPEDEGAVLVKVTGTLNYSRDSTNPDPETITQILRNACDVPTGIARTLGLCVICASASVDAEDTGNGIQLTGHRVPAQLKSPGDVLDACLGMVALTPLVVEDLTTDGTHKECEALFRVDADYYTIKVRRN